MYEGDHGRGHGFHRGHGKRAMRFLQQHDANEDGQLTQSEIDGVRAQRLADFDADGDGALTLQEYQPLWLEAMRSRMVDRFQHLDADGDASVTLEEFKAPMSRIVVMMDRNGDGVLSPEDRRGRGKRHHHDYDDDDDDDKGENN